LATSHSSFRSSFAKLLASARLHPYAVLFGLALAFRLACALLFRQPGYTDGYYYSNVAASLWQGQGFREDYIWNYLAHPLPENVLNNPSSTYWMPLTSVLIYLAYLLTGGPSFFASQSPNLLISAGLVPLTYYAIKDIFKAGRGEYYGWLSAGLMLFCGLYAPYFALPDNFAPFALFSFLVLICHYKALRLLPGAEKQARWLMAAAGFCTGLAYLTRVDGVLLLGVALLTLLLNRYWLKRESALGWSALGLMGLVFGLTLLPWLGRNLLDTNQLFPGGGLKTLFLREYDDFFSSVKQIDVPYYLNQRDASPNWGIGPLLLTKLDALWQNLLIIGRGTLFFMLPLFGLGLFSKVNDSRPNSEMRVWLFLRPEFLPFTVYVVGLYLAMSLLFTFPSTRGSVFHSSGGLLPFIYTATLVGLDRFIEWLALISRPKAGPARRKFYSRLLLIVAAILSVGFTLQLAKDWNADYDELKAVGTWLEANGAAKAIVMSPDVPAYYYVNHQPSLVITSDNLAADLAIARRYGASYIILQPNHFPPHLTELYNKKAAPGFRLVAQLGPVQLYKIE